MRYLGQWRSLTIAVDTPLRSLQDAVERFHDEHEREYTYRRDGAPVEIYQLQLQAIGVTPKPELARQDPEDHEPEPYATRAAVFDDGAEPVATALYRRDALRAGARIPGPAVIEQLDSTVVVPPGVTAEVDEWLMIRMHIPTEEER
jgi:N-methylhydantoinase A